MKYTLKNRPQYPDKTSGLTKRDYVRACIAYDDWLEGFEKELEEWETTLRQWQLSGEKKGSRTRPSMLYVIQEVLGVEGKEKAKP